MTSSPSLSTLLRAAASETVFPFLATTGVRLSLVGMLFLVASHGSLQQVGRFDVFIVASSVALIAISLGFDSGLALVVRLRSSRARIHYLIASLTASLAIGGVFVLVTVLLVRGLFEGLVVEGSDLVSSVVFACANSAMLMIFSFYRWIGKSRVASLTLIVANAVAFSAALMVWIRTKDVRPVMQVLALGGLLGSVFVVGYVMSAEKVRSIGFRPNYAIRIFAKLVKVSFPFVCASLLLLGRRLVDRTILLSVGSVVLLGGFATVSRFAEVLAFAMSVPAIGLSPIVVKRGVEAAGKRLARVVLAAYLTLSAVVMVAALVAWVVIGVGLFPEQARGIAPLFLAVLGGSILFGQTSVTGYGFIINRKTRDIAILAFLYIGIYILIATPFVFAGDIVAAIGYGFTISSLVYVSVFVYLSEKQCRMGYPQRLVMLVNFSIASVAMYPIFGMQS